MDSDMNTAIKFANDNENEDESPSNMMEQSPGTQLGTTIVLMRAMTWNRESYGLFDYESKNLK
jgi:hypothetical protein